MFNRTHSGVDKSVAPAGSPHVCWPCGMASSDYESDALTN